LVIEGLAVGQSAAPDRKGRFFTKRIPFARLAGEIAGKRCGRTGNFEDRREITETAGKDQNGRKIIKTEHKF
jgi:hypothetical protein